ncbi:hypothetical protein BVRB_8g202120 [Beta vulgaris subsp. vulgaris]|uniref:Uncharacterized protein n=1 Tax=Beta vulgaris subsp. vulgaris TaxID=3555 RepID=A0A0J8B5M8_BETVV|nr:hypothetical protein BVRB_8g202120 [Beta vulgaris subsp. vulgaris]
MNTRVTIVAAPMLPVAAITAVFSLSCPAKQNETSIAIRIG